MRPAPGPRRCPVALHDQARSEYHRTEPATAHQSLSFLQTSRLHAAHSAPRWPSDCSTSPSNLWLLAFVSPPRWSGREATRIPQGDSLRAVVYVQWRTGHDPGRRAAHSAPPAAAQALLSAVLCRGRPGCLAARRSRATKAQVTQHKIPLQATEILVAVEPVASL